MAPHWSEFAVDPLVQLEALLVRSDAKLSAARVNRKGNGVFGVQHAAWRSVKVSKSVERDASITERDQQANIRNSLKLSNRLATAADIHCPLSSCGIFRRKRGGSRGGNAVLLQAARGCANIESVSKVRKCC